MTAIQQNYGKLSKGIVGTFARYESGNEPRVQNILLSSATNIYPGSVIELSSGRGIITPDGVDGYAIILQEIVGNSFKEGVASDYYNTTSLVSVCTVGVIYVTVNESVVKGDKLIYDATDSISEKASRYKKDADTPTTTIRQFTAFESASAGELVAVEIR